MYSVKFIPYIKKMSVSVRLCVCAPKDLDNDSNDKFLLYSVAVHIIILGEGTTNLILEIALRKKLYFDFNN